MSRVVPLHYVEAALLSVISTTGGPEGQPLGAKRLTVDKVTEICEARQDDEAAAFALTEATATRFHNGRFWRTASAARASMVSKASRPRGR